MDWYKIINELQEGYYSKLNENLRLERENMALRERVRELGALVSKDAGLQFVADVMNRLYKENDEKSDRIAELEALLPQATLVECETCKMGYKYSRDMVTETQCVWCRIRDLEAEVEGLNNKLIELHRQAGGWECEKDCEELTKRQSLLVRALEALKVVEKNTGETHRCLLAGATDEAYRDNKKNFDAVGNAIAEIEKYLEV